MAEKLIYHGLVARSSTLAMDLEIMRQAGFDGLEVSAAKLQAMRDAGFSDAELQMLFKDLYVPGIGFLLDLERHGPNESGLIIDAEHIFELAVICGAQAVQVINGPVEREAVLAVQAGKNWSGYIGVLGLDHAEQVTIMANNLAMLADRAAVHGLTIYLETLAWLPLKRLSDQVEVIRRANRPNLKMVIDFWHCYASGDGPENIRKLDKELICGVHFCDSRAFEGGVPDEPYLRDIPTGQGALNLGDWVDAVKSTGFKGWWSCELFCRKQHQDNSFAVARDLHKLMSDLIL